MSILPESWWKEKVRGGRKGCFTKPFEAWVLSPTWSSPDNNLASTETNALLLSRLDASPTITGAPLHPRCTLLLRLSIPLLPSSWI